MVQGSKKSAQRFAVKRTADSEAPRGAARKRAPKRQKLRGAFDRAERDVTAAINKNIEDIMAAKVRQEGSLLRVVKEPPKDRSGRYLVNVDSKPRFGRPEAPNKK